MHNLFNRIVALILTTRFIPVETILALGSVVVGIFLAIPTTAALIFPPLLEMTAALWLIVVGGLHFTGLLRDNENPRRVGLRRFGTFFEFINLVYVSVLLLYHDPPRFYGAWGYSLLALVAATAYLSTTHEKDRADRRNGDD